MPSIYIDISLLIRNVKVISSFTSFLKFSMLVSFLLLAEKQTRELIINSTGNKMNACNDNDDWKMFYFFYQFDAYIVALSVNRTYRINKNGKLLYPIWFCVMHSQSNADILFC